MAKFGFSIYPETHSFDEMASYIAFMANQGASRIFMSLLQLHSDDNNMFEYYRSLIEFANSKGLSVIADISPDFIQQNGWDKNLIDKAYRFGLSGLRLDEALPLEEIAQLTHNPYGIKIELNMSTDIQLLIELLKIDVNPNNIIGCHNFYPHEFTGLSVKHFLEFSKFYHECGIETAAFVNSHAANEGPWPLSEGLCTVEDHRHLPIGIQVSLLKATGLIDNILIANQFISDDEVKELKFAIEKTELTFKANVLDDLSDIEEKIITFDHKYRGDISDYVIRSTESRIAFKKDSILPREQDKRVKRGTILIDNDLYGRYKGELQISLKEFVVSDKVNVVGQLTQESLLLLDYLQPWQEFRLDIK